MKRAIGLMVVLAATWFAGFVAAQAQDADTAPVVPSTTRELDRSLDDDDDDDFNMGWLGLIGLAGLAGLLGRHRDRDLHRDHGAPVEQRRT
jgi:hypothetical protein